MHFHRIGSLLAGSVINIGCGVIVYFTLFKNSSACALAGSVNQDDHEECEWSAPLTAHFMGAIYKHCLPGTHLVLIALWITLHTGIAHYQQSDISNWKH